MERIATLVGLALISIALVTPAESSAEHLYFMTPGVTAENTEIVRRGFYGGPADTHTNGTVPNIYTSGYNCALFRASGRLIDEIELKSLSYDPITEKVLMQLEPDLTVVMGTLCKPVPQSCDNFTDLLQPMFLDARIAADSLGPFSQYDSKVYFLRHNRDQGTLQLRQFVGCEDSYPVTSIDPFDIDDCSRVVATVLSENSHPQTFKTMGHLLVHKTGSGVQFFTQLTRMTYKDELHIDTYVVELFLITEKGQVKSLHRQTVSKRFNRYRLLQVGGISLRDGLLCWSSMTHIRCANWDGKTLSNKMVLVDPSTSRTICQGLGGELANVTTGVAIAETQPNIVLYFGCVATGGGGMVRMPADGSQPARLFPLKSNRSVVNAESMILTRACDPRYQLVRGGSDVNRYHTFTWLLPIFLVLIFRPTAD